MAEARNAVGFNFTVDDEGDFNVDFNINSLKVVALSLEKYFVTRLNYLSRDLEYLFFPITPFQLFFPFFYITFFLGYYSNFTLFTTSFAVCSYVMPGGYQTVKNILAIITTPMFIYYFCSVVLQYIVGKLIMMYIFTEALLHSIKTPVYLVTLLQKVKKTLYLVVYQTIGRKYGLFTLQKSLPTLPVPSLHSTMDRWLKSIRPLVDDENYEAKLNDAKEFMNGVGKKLQLFLICKSWLTSNYFNDWWEKYVYLSSRSPIVINSNYYAMDRYLQTNKKVSSRAANIVSSMIDFMESIKTAKLKPIVNMDVVPLCSQQYVRMFGTTRIPHHDRDIIRHYDNPKHIVVLHGGKYYKLPIYLDGKRLTNLDLQSQFEYILNDIKDSKQNELDLASLTSLPRNEWATIKSNYFSHGINRSSYHEICKAAFFVSFVDEECSYENQPGYSKYAQSLIHGTGNNIWFDKSITLLVFKNGTVGWNLEHSWADAPVISHMCEFSLYHDTHTYGYTENGDCEGTKSSEVLEKPTLLNWDLNNLTEHLRDAMEKVQHLISDIDLVVVPFHDFGKGQIKSIRMSPDAFIQIALQLTYFEDIGHFDLTYEASMLRIFRDGRTETVRACTKESCDFILSLKNPSITDEEKIALFRSAANAHVAQYRRCMVGLGCDRHIFALYVASKIFNYEVNFLKDILMEPWKLSTSQTPVGMANYAGTTSGLDSHTAGGGFGPVADDGYGVSYIICGENLITFHVSSKKSSDFTNSERFMSNLTKSMNMLLQLCKNN